MINLQNLSYRYGKGVNALDDVTAQIPPGLHLLLGENGSGKTTLLHVIAGLRLAQPADSCMIDGVSTASRTLPLSSEVFILTDSMTFPYNTIAEMVRYHAPFYPTFSHEQLRRNLEAFGMDGNEPIDRFSLGNRKKAQLAYILALRPRVLLLDEPANGLDISARDTLVHMLAENMSDEQTVIVSTHVVFDFKNIVDSVMVLSHGKLLLSMPVWDIAERLSFISAPLPPANALYIQQSIGRFDAIVPNDGGDATDIDFVVFYNALQSNSRVQLLNLLIGKNPVSQSNIE